MQIEDLFHQLLEQTEDMIKILESFQQAQEKLEIDHLFAKREALLVQLRKDLELCSDRSIYQPLYNSWQEKETELRAFVKDSLQDLDKKITESQNARTVSKQYDSYLRQMPYGAFLDKKR